MKVSLPFVLASSLLFIVNSISGCSGNAPVQKIPFVPYLDGLESMAGHPIPPSHLTRNDFANMNSWKTYDDLVKAVGIPHADVGGGTHLYVYRLKDGYTITFHVHDGRIVW